MTRTPLLLLTAWRQIAFSFELSTDLGRLWTQSRVFDTYTFMSRSLVLLTSSNWKGIGATQNTDQLMQHGYQVEGLIWLAYMFALYIHTSVKQRNAQGDLLWFVWPCLLQARPLQPWFQHVSLEKGNRTNRNRMAFWSIQIACKYTLCLYPKNSIDCCEIQKCPNDKSLKNTSQIAPVQFCLQCEFCKHVKRNHGVEIWELRVCVSTTLTSFSS